MDNRLDIYYSKRKESWVHFSLLFSGLSILVIFILFSSYIDMISLFLAILGGLFCMTMALINLVEIYISEPRIYLSIDNEGITFVPLDGLIFVFSEDSIYVPNRETPTIRWEHITDISTMKEWYYTSVGGFKRWRVLIHVDNLYETGENPNQKTLCKQHYIDCDSIDISRKKLIHILNERLDKYRNSK